MMVESTALLLYKHSGKTHLFDNIHHSMPGGAFAQTG